MCGDGIYSVLVSVDMSSMSSSVIIVAPHPTSDWNRIMTNRL